jgi:hypothetical protein
MRGSANPVTLRLRRWWQPTLWIGCGEGLAIQVAAARALVSVHGMHERPTTQNGDHDPEPVEPDEDYEPHEREERAEVFEEAEDAKREAEDDPP